MKSRPTNSQENKNPYIGCNGRPLLKKSVVAYIDMLGYAETIRGVHKTKTDKQFLVSFRQMLDDLYKLLQFRRTHKDTGKNRYEVRAFTDNIVIGVPIDDDTEPELDRILWTLASLQLVIILSGFFVRGAIALGPAFIDNDIVFGKGLLDAYDTEREIARDPRIVLTKPVIDRVSTRIRKDVRKYGHPNKMSAQYRYLLRDADGQVFLNYLECIGGIEEEDPETKLMFMHRDMVEERLKENVNRPSIWSKYAWVANYHNYFCMEHARIYGEIFSVDLKGLQMQPKRLV